MVITVGSYRELLLEKLGKLEFVPRDRNPLTVPPADQLHDILERFVTFDRTLLDRRGVMPTLFAQYVNEVWLSEFPPECKLNSLEIVELLLANKNDDALKELNESRVQNAPEILTRLVNLLAASRFLLGDNFLAHRERDLDEGLIKEVHSIAMQGDATADPGLYRTNAVFAAGSSVAYALPETIESRLKVLIRFTNRQFKKYRTNNQKQFLISVLFFSEFLLIHPFRDGNGRTARLITNHMMRGIVFVPISLFFRNRQNYQEVLEDRNGPSTAPCTLAFFFLQCASYTCDTVIALTLSSDDKTASDSSDSSDDEQHNA